MELRKLYKHNRLGAKRRIEITKQFLPEVPFDMPESKEVHSPVSTVLSPVHFQFRSEIYGEANFSGSVSWLALPVFPLSSSKAGRNQEAP
ncbi:MAG TPA: hypothetical protein VEU98_02280 [Candidatus Eremiobacteraceae bacterium]|nr:hypothetical protein [Candidatus Eremiobacteraceae bacterium]